MRKSLLSILFVGLAVFLLTSVIQLIITNDTVEESHPTYRGVNQVRSGNSFSMTSGMPQPTIKPVNVTLKQYHAKANVHYQNYTLRQQSVTYSTNGGLTLSSSASTHSYGGGMSDLASGNFFDNNQNYTVSFHFSPIQSGYPQIIADQSAVPSFSTNTYSVPNTYRAIGGPTTVELLDDYYATNTLGVTDQGDGTYVYNESWITGFYAYLAMRGYTMSDPRYDAIVAGIGTNGKYFPENTTSPPPGDPFGDEFPIGNGTWVMLALVIGYMIIRNKKLKSAKI